MAFILAAQRDRNVTDAFSLYQTYLAQSAAQFPSSAYDLATSNWYFDFHDHRYPHDAWLENLTIVEPASGERQEQRTTSIRLRLLAAYHDGYIEIYYPVVYSYQLTCQSASDGHQDWRYDEFRLREQGGIIHEIEWSGASETARWLIEASDVEYTWLPR